MQGTIRGRTIAACALAAAVGAVFAVAVVAHTSRTDSDISLFGFTSGGADEYFYGDIASAKGACEPNRKVRIFRKRPGDDALYDATRSLEPAGSYTVTAATGNLPQGDYYSHIRKRDLKPGKRHEHLCKGAKSAELDVGP
jgi:hypothetical protein